MPEAPAETEGSGSQLSRADPLPRHRGAVQGLLLLPAGARPSLGASAAPGPSPGQPTREEAGSRQLRSRELEACLPLPGA